jgi:hypothetical protein
MPKLIYYLLLSQGLYFVITGLWAIIDISSFMLVTGPKTDVWLVKTVSLLLTVMGIVFLIAAREKSISASVKALSVLAAAVLLFVDVFYYLKGVIRSVYLADAVIQLVCIMIWFLPKRNQLSSNRGLLSL